MARTVDPARHAAKKAAIRDAALLVFAERGYTGATTAQICRRARVGSGTLFHYFPDKRSLMVAIFEADQERDAEVVAGLDLARPLAELWRLLDHLTRDAADPLAPGLVLAMLQLAVEDEEFVALLERGDQRLRDAFASLLRAADGIEVESPSLTAKWLLGLVDTLYLNVGDTPADDIAELRRLVGRYLGCAVPSPPS